MKKWKSNRDAILVFFPKLDNFIVRIADGTGDNLLPEDEAEGYVDYLMLETFKVEDGYLIADDGGQIMQTVMNIDLYNGDIANAIPDVVDYFCDDYLFGEEREAVIRSAIIIG